MLHSAMQKSYGARSSFRCFATLNIKAVKKKKQKIPKTLQQVSADLVNQTVE